VLAPPLAQQVAVDAPAGKGFGDHVASTAGRSAARVKEGLSFPIGSVPSLVRRQPDTFCLSLSFGIEQPRKRVAYLTR
jgi:hypothetical protein